MDDEMESHVTPQLLKCRKQLDAALYAFFNTSEDIAAETESNQSLFDNVHNTSRDETSRSEEEVLDNENRKRRKRRCPINHEKLSSDKFIRKYFDRSVNLAQFSEHSPLYPICRAWVYNNLSNDCCVTSQMEVQTQVADDDIISMPSPLSYSSTKDLRIPSPLPLDNEEINMNSCDELLKHHIKRWKKVKNKWTEASQKNELRYVPSIQLLNSIIIKN